MSDGDSIHAGEETDVCVAREVFGFQVREMWLWIPESEGSRRYEEKPPTNDFDKALYTAERQWCFYDPGIGFKPIPRYSRHHLDAMAIVEHFRRKQCRIVLEGENWPEGGEWFCKILHPPNFKIVATGRDEAKDGGEPSFPLAVCRAALRYAAVSRGEG